MFSPPRTRGRLIPAVSLLLCWLLGGNTAHAEQHIRVGGSGTDLATLRILAAAYMKESPGVTIKVLPSLGSGGGVKAVAKGRVDIGLTSRPLKTQETTLPVMAHLYARTPMVFITSQQTQATAIDSQTIFDVMNGKTKHWPTGQQIRLVLRPLHDSDSLLLQRTYPQAQQALEQAHQVRGVPVAMTDQESATSVEQIPGSIGTSTLALITSENRQLQALTLDGVEPTAENIQHDHYPMHKALYLVLPTTPKAAALRFTRFIASSAGQQILTDTGHLPVPFKLD